MLKKIFILIGIVFFDFIRLYAQEGIEGHIRNLTEAALAGDTEAMYYLGGIFYSQEPPDYAEAVKWIQKAAEKGHAGGQYLWGVMCCLGKGITEDQEQARYWLLKAADSDDSLVSVKARKLLRQCYPSAVTTLWDSVELYDWGRYYWKEKDSAQAILCLREAARRGNVEAQYFLGYLFLESDTGKQDTAEALKWMHTAAERGYAGAQFYLGRWKEKEGKDKEALEWYMQAAEQGFPEAEYNVGVMYYLGKGADRNEPEAFKWTFRAAAGEVVEAQYNLGVMYYTRQEYEEAGKWFRKAASRGHRQAREQWSKLLRKCKAQ